MFTRKLIVFVTGTPSWTSRENRDFLSGARSLVIAAVVANSLLI